MIGGLTLGELSQRLFDDARASRLHRRHAQDRRRRCRRQACSAVRDGRRDDRGRTDAARSAANRRPRRHSGQVPRPHGDGSAVAPRCQREPLVPRQPVATNATHENERRQIVSLLESYPNAKTVVWVQGEPKNMGARAHVRRQLVERLPKRFNDIDYVARPYRASPSEGYSGAHAAEQERVIKEALNE